MNYSFIQNFSFKLLSGVDAAVLVALFIYAKLIIIARKDRIQKDPCDSRDCKSCQRDSCASDMESNAFRESQTADKDDRCDDQVSRFCQIDLILNDVAHTDR